MNTFYALIFWISGFLYFSNPLSAQAVADSLWLDEVQVQASRVYVQDRYQAIQIVRVDSAMLQFLASGTMASILEVASPVFVRSNGPGGLTTFSNRGFSSSQTQVLWNGFQLNHAMLGSTDLSLIPGFMVQEVVTSSGDGNTGLGEKGGGSVAFTSRHLQKTITMALKKGDLGIEGVEAGTGFSSGPWKVDVLLGAEKAENDFTYTTREFSNEAGGFVEVVKRRQNNAKIYETGLISAQRSWVGADFATYFWGYNSENEIPGGISGLSAEARQDDAFLRWMTRYSTVLGRHRLTGKLYLNSQKLDYFNAQTDLASLSTTHATLADVEWKTNFFERLQWNMALQLGRNRVESSEYPSNPVRNQGSVSVNPVWLPLDFLYVYGGLRSDFYSDFGQGTSWKAGLNVQLLDEHIFIHGQTSRNFVTPTFNDLFWPGAGNPDLVPEKINKQEIGLRVLLSAQKMRHEWDFTVYKGRVKNGIRWLPISGSISMPFNIDETDLSGFEATSNHKLFLANFTLHLQGIVTHNLAAFSKPRFNNDTAVGKQLFYTPEWQFKGFSYVQWKSLHASFSYSLVEERFTTADHSSAFDPLPAYSIYTLTLSYTFAAKSTQNTMGLGINNLFDETYSIVRDYPMPGRYLKFSFKTNIKYKTR